MGIFPMVGLANLFLWLGFAACVFFWVPSDAQQGIAQRIFYFHVPTAWVSFTGFLIACFYSIRYLKKRNELDDLKAAASATIGWIFTSAVLITGPLWAKPIWGHFWNWSDPRLVSFFVLWLAFAGYLLLRAGVYEQHQRARLSAVVAILGALDVPFVYLAIRIWNTPSHPGPVVGGDEGSGLLDWRMHATFWYGVLVFHTLFALVAHLYYNYLKLSLKLMQREQTFN